MDTAMDTAMEMKPANRRKHIRLAASLLGLVCTAPLVVAQTADERSEPKQSASVDTRLTITQTWSDNIRLTSVPQAEQLTELSPGIRVTFQKPRFKGFFDYARNGYSYANATTLNHSTNALSSNFSLEALDNLFFVEASGSISQQAASAFGPQSVDNGSVNPNLHEVGTYRLSPYLQGHLGSSVTYLGRFTRTVTSTDAIAGQGISTNESSLTLKGDLISKSVGWTADFNKQEVSYSIGRATENGRGLLGLTFSPTTQLNLTAEVGTESNNFTSVTNESSQLSGLGLNWTPSESSKLAANARHHSYGNTYTLSFDRRTARTVWHFSDSRDVTQSPNLQGSVSLGSVYDLYYSQFASTEPDPVARAQLVNAYLQTYGISPDAPVSTGFTASSLALQRMQQLSFGLLGVRDTITFIATQSESNRLDALTTAVDDFTTASVIRQSGLSANFSHRLTPDFSFGLMVAQTKTTGTLSIQSTTLRSTNMSLTGKVGKKSFASFSLRKVDSDNSVTPYAENAAVVTLNLQF